MKIKRRARARKMRCLVIYQRFGSQRIWAPHTAPVSAKPFVKWASGNPEQLWRRNLANGIA